MNPISIDSHLLLLSAIVTVAMQLSFFFVAATFKFDKVTDFAGGTNFVVLAIMTFVLGEIYSARQIVALIFVSSWGLRLSIFLLIRILKTGTDKRFDDTRDNFFKFLGFWVYQMFWVWTVSLPVIYLNTTEVNPTFGEAADIAGVCMFAVGLILEAISDQQKYNFKNDQSNAGKWCDIGLWKISRHPNYFGEILLWWGIFVMATSAFRADGYTGYFTVLGPVFITSILLFVSGLPILEKNADKRFGTRNDYKQYKLDTSILIPIPTGLYKMTPVCLKKTVLFEWPMYDSIGLYDPRQRELLASNESTP